MDILFEAILNDNRPAVQELLKNNSSLVACHFGEARLYETEIFHWMYVGDTCLHLAAAGYRVEIVESLLGAGADPNSATNHRHSTPLHYASDGYIMSQAWNPKRQVKTITYLLDAGADVNAQDKNGATSLHRAVRTRCAAAVQVLLAAGSDTRLTNKAGSTAFHLAVQNTGREGTGTQAAKDAQRQIIERFLSLGVSVSPKDGNGKSVLGRARSGWIQEIFRLQAR